jgi:tRNA (cmo5U34)-methyltransferase
LRAYDAAADERKVAAIENQLDQLKNERDTRTTSGGVVASDPGKVSGDSRAHMPEHTWAFDDGVTDVFEDMLERSIPSYTTMRDLVRTLGKRFVQPDTAIVDLGCSNGLALEPFTRIYGAHNRYIGVEISEPMAAAAAARFASWPSGQVRIYQDDLRTFYPKGLQTSLTLAVLTLMFVPVNYRNMILRNAYTSTVPGGALIVVEKLLGDYPETDELFVDAYHAMKLANGYSLEAIERKRLALEGVQVPITDAANMLALDHAGFDVVECFWKHLNFAGYIAIKR